MVVTPLVIAICLLIPAQSKTALAIELLGIDSALRRYDRIPAGCRSPRYR